jgi:malate dehydrogenase (oxaloacetate-decarboxylating)(NADP+)
MGLSNPLKRQMKAKAKKAPKRIVMSDADHYNILKAAEIVHNEKLAIPILLGNKKRIEEIIKENELELEGVQIIDPKCEDEANRRKQFAEILYKKRQRKGLSFSGANEFMHHKNYYAPMLVETGVADAVLAGMTRSYPSTIRPALEVIGKNPSLNIVSGMHIINTKEGPLFLSDTTVNQKPTCEELVEITVQTARAVRQFNINPVIAMVSYSNFGSVNGDSPNRMRQAVRLLHERYPELQVDGEMQVNVALNQELMKENFSFSEILGKKVNTLIFPNLAASNAAYKLIGELTDFEIIGPVLNGMNKPVKVLQMGSTVDEFVNMAMIAVIDSQKI